MKLLIVRTITIKGSKDSELPNHQRRDCREQHERVERRDQGSWIKH